MFVLKLSSIQMHIIKYTHYYECAMVAKKNFEKNEALQHSNLS